MAHHGDSPFEGFEDPRKLETFKNKQDELRKLLDATNFKGALGDFPEGKLTKSDEGAIQFAVGSHNGKVIIDFGTSVHWVGMTAQQAADFASLVLKRAREVGRANGETVTMTIGGP